MPTSRDYAVAILLVLCATSCATGPTPEDVPFASISTGKIAHTCAVASDGAAYCWGNNRFSQLGGGAVVLDNQALPLRVESGIPFSVVRAAGFHSCALDLSGAAYCWGMNEAGQLGTGDNQGPQTCSSSPCATAPVTVSTGLTFTEIDGGWYHTCALSTAGDVYCWGGNASGQIGSGPTGPESHSPSPTQVQSDLKFTAVSVGIFHTCALAESGEAYCWGSNGTAQLGPLALDLCLQENGTSAPCSATPVLAAEGFIFVAIAAGWRHTCGLVADGTVYCWGDGDTGQLGIPPESALDECPGTGSPECSLQPVLVSGDLTFVAMAAGRGHTCGLTGDEQAYCLGSHSNGQLGDCSQRDYSSLPQPVCGGHRFSLVVAGGLNTCGLLADGAAYCWGGNTSGQLGNGLFGVGLAGPEKVAQAGR